jgi:ATP-binding cassette subfamily B protein
VLTKLVLDDIVAGTGFPVAPVIALGVLGVVAAAVPNLTGYMQSELDRRLDLAARQRLYRAVDGFTGLGRFEDPAFVDRLRLAEQSVGSALAPGTTGLFGLVRDAVSALGLLGALFSLSPVLTGVVVLAAGPGLAAQLAMSRHRTRLIAELSPRIRRQIFYGSLLSDVRAAKEVRLLGLGKFLQSRMFTELRAIQAADRGRDRAELRSQSMFVLLGASISAIGLVWAVAGAVRGELSVGDVSLFVVSLAGVQAAISGLVQGTGFVHETLTMFGHFRHVVALPADLPAADSARVPAPLREGIELRDVWFRYAPDQPWVLRGVSLTIPAGSAVGLVGGNGAGKSTLVKLLCRFYDPDRGAIMWDGVDLRDLDIAALRARIGTLFQDYMCYDLTAAENIAVGDLAQLDDRGAVRTAAQGAGAHDMLQVLPRGYDTMLSKTFYGESDGEDPETGVTLSGGQWQRLAIARCYMRGDRDLVVLDEPSAGLDAEAEHEVHQGVRRYRGNRTSLLISHRLGAIRAADTLIVLADGRVAEQGTHAELMAIGGRYARMFSLQAKGYRDENAPQAAV